MFAPAHVRRYRDGDELKEETVVHPLFERYVSEGRDISHFQGSYDLTLRDHFEMQRTCQKHIDNAVSKTINVQPGTSHEELSELWMEFFPDLKGVTVYPEGSREDQPLSPISLEEALRATNKRLSAYAQDSCRDGKCDL
jgi:ribonucleotide reductase alpha subunit